MYLIIQTVNNAIFMLKNRSIVNMCLENVMLYT